MPINRRWSDYVLTLLVLFAATPLASQSPPQTAAPAAPRPIAPPRVPSDPTAQAATGLPSARQVIDRHLAEIGGRKAILAHSSSHMTGTISIPSAGLTGPVELFAAKPNKAVLRSALPGVGDIQEGFDGTNGWSISAMTGPTLTQGRELEQKKFDSDFYADLHNDDRYESMTTVEKTTFEGRPSYKVRLVRRGGGEDFEFYDIETGLRSGSVVTRETPMGAITGTNVLTDYRRFGDVLLPTTIRLSLPMGLQQIIAISAVEFDNVPPTTFEPPAAIKALIK